MVVVSGCTSSDEPVELKKSDIGEVNTLSNIHLEIVENTLTSEGLTLRIVNDSEKSLVYNGSFSIEQKVNEEWFEVEDVVGGNFAFTDEGLGTNPHESSELSIEWDWLYGELKTGEYRLVKEVLDFRDAGDFDRHFLAVEFEILN